MERHLETNVEKILEYVLTLFPDGNSDHFLDFMLVLGVTEK